MTYFDARIPGLKMTVVQADGNAVQPVTVDEFRIAVAETCDVIVRPTEDKAYTMFAESMGRSGFARATLAPRQDMEAPVPERRRPPLLTMADMGHAHAMDHGSHGSMADMDHAAMSGTHTMADGTVMAGMAHGDGHAMPGITDDRMRESESHAGHGGMDHGLHGDRAEAKQDPFYAPGSGLVPTAAMAARSSPMPT